MRPGVGFQNLAGCPGKGEAAGIHQGDREEVSEPRDEAGRGQVGSGVRKRRERKTILWPVAKWRDPERGEVLGQTG